MITLELEKGVYYIKEDGKTLITLHYGYDGQESPEDHKKHLNVVFNPKLWGSTRQFVSLHMISGQLHIGLEEESEV